MTLESDPTGASLHLLTVLANYLIVAFFLFSIASRGDVCGASSQEFQQLEA